MPYWRTQDLGFTGWAYPFHLDAQGHVAQATTDVDRGVVDSLKQALQQLISTPKGSRFFNRSFGAKPIDIVFRRNLPEEMMLFASELQDLLVMWEPRLILTKFEIVEQFESTAILRIGFRIRRTQLTGFVDAEIPMEA